MGLPLYDTEKKWKFQLLVRYCSAGRKSVPRFAEKGGSAANAIAFFTVQKMKVEAYVGGSQRTPDQTVCTVNRREDGTLPVKP